MEVKLIRNRRPQVKRKLTPESELFEYIESLGKAQLDRITQLTTIDITIETAEGVCIGNSFVIK
jgi:hypothetical protein